ncbi:MAG: hypothetical protein M3Q40_02535 [Pseudomonadota bacterium]|nr:hypothetical protein [Pseudomonadota bacterium]
MAMLLMLPGCGDEVPVATNSRGEPVEALPAPRAGTRGVTGMPDSPGPGPVGPVQDAARPEPVYDSEGNLVAPAELLPGDGLPGDSLVADGADPVDGEAFAAPPLPGAAGAVQDAVTLVAQYYQSIQERRFDVARALWADGGRASGQTPEQFASGFDNLATVSVEVMRPERFSTMADARTVEVPVAIASTRRDGSVHRYVGAYTLRATAAPSSGGDPTPWRIASADIREVQP